MALDGKVNTAWSTVFYLYQKLKEADIDEVDEPLAREKKNTQVLEWFSTSFGQYQDDQCEISLDSFLQAASELEDFGNFFFDLFDDDRSGSVSLLELTGGLQKLSSTGLKQKQDKKVIAWTVKKFESVADSSKEVTKEKFIRIIDDKRVLKKLFSLFDIDNGGKVSLAELLRGINKLNCMSKNAKWISWIEAEFDNKCANTQEITLEEFTAVMGSKDFFAERFFNIFDVDQSHSVSLSELIGGFEMLGDDGTESDKLKFLFKVYDIDGNDQIERCELKKVLEQCTKESRMVLEDSVINELTDVLFKFADSDNSGAISFEELEAVISSEPLLVKNLTINASSIFKQPVKKVHPIKAWLKDTGTYFTVNFIRNNLALVSNLVVIFLLYVLAFVMGMVMYSDKGIAMMLAKGSGKCMSLTMVFLFLTMSRLLLTKIRETPLCNVLALDYSIDLHKFLGYMFCVFATIHTIAHLVNLYVAGYRKFDYLGKLLWTTSKGLGHLGIAYQTGLALIVFISFTTMYARPSVRKKPGGFTEFFFSHLSYIVTATLCLFHGKTFYTWFIVPGAIFIVEKIVNSRALKRAMHGRTYINNASTLPSNVTHLEITRPKTFNFNAGDYVFLTIPELTEYEKHPFTISSSSENKAFISIHIRGCGTWTNKLFKFVEKKEKERNELIVVRPKSECSSHGSPSETDISEVIVTNKEVSLEMETKGDHSNGKVNPWKANPQNWFRQQNLEVYVDGPYGAPAVEIFEAEHAVLIAGGIGVTPYASILQTIMDMHNKFYVKCPDCEKVFIPPDQHIETKIKKLDFIWINRDRKSFEWFLDLLRHLEKESAKISKVNKLKEGENFLDIHMYMTSALKKEDVKAVALQMALELMHKRDNKDVQTGLQSRMKPGRPDWEEVFQEIDSQKKGKVEVFFCGSPFLATTIHSKCDKFGFKFKAEKF